MKKLCLVAAFIGILAILAGLVNHYLWPVVRALEEGFSPTLLFYGSIGCTALGIWMIQMKTNSKSPLSVCRRQAGVVILVVAAIALMVVFYQARHDTVHLGPLP